MSSLLNTGLSSLKRSLIMLAVLAFCILPAGAFLSGLEASKKKQNVVRGIIALANSLGLTVLAEGVENEAQLDFLIAEHCHSAQGFFMSQPIEENLLTNHLAAREGRMRDTDKFRLGLSA